MLWVHSIGFQLVFEFCIWIDLWVPYKWLLCTIKINNKFYWRVGTSWQVKWRSHTCRLMINQVLCFEEPSHINYFLLVLFVFSSSICKKAKGGQWLITNKSFSKSQWNGKPSYGTLLIVVGCETSTCR